MARGRFLSTSVAEDDRLSKLSITAELLYLKTIPHLDRDGMITGRAGALWGKVCPLRDELIGEMQASIDEWVQVGLVVRMMTDKGPVLFFPGFLKNNTLLHYDRETPSLFPVPPGYERTPMGLVLEGTEQKRKPTKKPKEAKVPPSSNNSGAGINDKVNEPVNDKVNDFVSEVEVEVEVKDQDQIKAAEGEAAPAAAATDPNVARVWEAWDANMPGTKTPVIVDGVNALIDEYSATEIVEAIAIACRRHRRNLGYVEGVLAKGAFSERPPSNGGDYRSNRGANVLRTGTDQRNNRASDESEYDPEIQRRFDEFVAQRKAEGSAYYNWKPH